MLEILNINRIIYIQPCCKSILYTPKVNVVVTKYTIYLDN